MALKKIYIVTDGGSRGNPGPSAIAFGIYDDEWNILEENAELIGHATNNEAEYQALINALDCASKYCRQDIVHYSDSELVVNQMNADWGVGAKNLKPLVEEAFKKRQFFGNIQHMHLPRENSKIQKIDDLLNAKMDEEKIKKRR